MGVAHGYFCASSGLKVGHSLAACNIERHRSLVVHDQPISAELPEAEGAQDPHPARRRPVLQRAAEPGALLRSGQIRAVGFPDLLVAAVAERERVTVLHYDGDYDLIAHITGQPMRWVVPRGTVP